MTFEALYKGVWRPIDVVFMSWPSIKGYADQLGLPVREVNDEGLAIREYHPAEKSND